MPSEVSSAAASWLGTHAGWLVSLGLLSCDPFGTQFDDRESARLYRATELTPTDPQPEHLSIMTYNIKFGGGRIDFFFDCHGDAVLMKEAEVQRHLNSLAQFIRRVDPDLLFLQEVEVNSKRSAYMDQVRWLLNTTALNYAAYASAWRSDYVPSDGLGPVDMGNAVLSKYPIRDATRLQLPLIEDQSALERYFYLKRNILRAQLDVGGEPVFAVTTHTSAFAQDGTKLRQIEAFKRELDRIRDNQGLFVAGGDLNTLPPGSDKTAEFPDSVCTDEDFQADDYREEGDWLEPLYRDYQPAVDLDLYQLDNAPHFTHTTDKQGFWNRKLDYLFTNGSFAETSATTHQDSSSTGIETMQLSDHAPLSVSLKLP